MVSSHNPLSLLVLENLPVLQLSLNAISLSHVYNAHSPLISSRKETDFESSRSRNFHIAAETINPKDSAHASIIPKAQIQKVQVPALPIVRYVISASLLNLYVPQFPHL